MSEKTFFNRLTLFQGVLIGIYGNWLISFLDKFRLSETSVLTNLFLVSSFLTFLFFFWLCWLSSKQRASLFFAALHIVFVLSATLLEWSTMMDEIWSIVIGQGIFFLLAAFVATTSKYEELFIRQK